MCTSHTVVAYPTLNMHWAALIVPSLFLQFGPLLVITTTFSAQSPHSMKGLLIGIFFSISGLFQLLNSIIVIQLSPWSVGKIANPPVINCAAKRYKYRVRDEGEFRQYIVEEIYDCYITQTIESTDECSLLRH